LTGPVTARSVFSVGLFSNRWLLAGVGFAIVLQVGAVHSPLGQLLFRTTALSGFDWLLIVLVSSSIWVADEILKLLGVYGRKRRRNQAKAEFSGRRKEKNNVS
jgi:magnesium-transporting ATPase (P-type)